MIKQTTEETKKMSRKLMERKERKKRGVVESQRKGGVIICIKAEKEEKEITNLRNLTLAIQISTTN